MKLLFDQNLSFKLAEIVSSAFPDSNHLRDFNLARASDDAVWAFAAEHGFALISKDSDFVHRALLRGHPPKVIYIRIGNASTDRIGQLLRESNDVINHFLADSVESVLMLQ